MVLSEETLKREIDSAEAAVRAHKEGAVINQIVLEAFRKELKKCTST